jgi:hypothetical protein
MLEFDFGSVRWGMLGATAGFMFVIAVAHFAYLKPLKELLDEEAARRKNQMATASLSVNVSSVATQCLAMAIHGDPTMASSGDVVQARRDVVGAGGHPLIEQALGAAEDAMAALEASLKEGGDKHVEAKKRAVLQACLAVTNEAGSLLTANDA